MRKIKDSKILLMAGQVAVLVLVLFGVNSARGFTEPGANPPAGNVDGVINTGIAAQTKTGKLTLPSGVTFGSGGSLKQTNLAGVEQAVLIGRDSSDSTQLYVGPSGNYYLRDASGNIWQQVANGSSAIGIGATPDAGADLTLGSKGLNLNGLTRNVWPTWQDYAPVSYVPTDRDRATCPTNSLLVGIRLDHGSGDKEYIASYSCRAIKDMYMPPIPPDDTEGPLSCVDGNGHIIPCPPTE